VFFSALMFHQYISQSACHRSGSRHQTANIAFVDQRYEYQKLKEFAETLLAGAGLDRQLAEVVADVLVEGDLLGKTTHGLQLLGPYLKSIKGGGMTLSGEPEVVRESAANLALNGKYLPGPYLVRFAIDALLGKIKTAGVATATIRHCHHIAALQSYLKPVTDRGCMIVLMCSDPSVKSVAPFGGTEPAFTPNPFAYGIPTDGDPILIDISASTTTNGQCMRLNSKGEKFPYDGLQTAEGEPTNDPGVIFADPPGTILPVGGQDTGHKGFALAIMVEALTAALGGHGRSDAPERWGGSVFVQIIDPEFFGGREYFDRETGWFAGMCRRNRPRPGQSAVQMPGDRALALRRDQLEHGVALHSAVVDGIEKWAREHGVPAPQPIG
jgi:LDH2 family malate/lactate/ureidoglycolate dehydrogenase